MGKKLSFHEHATINAHYAHLKSRGYFMPGARNGLTPKQQADAIAWGHYLRALGIVHDPTHGGTVRHHNHSAHHHQLAHPNGGAAHAGHPSLAQHNPYMGWTPAQLHAEAVKRGWRR